MGQFLKKHLVTIWLFQLAFLPLAIWATFTVPNTFTSGDTISASEMNANFSNIYSILNDGAQVVFRSTLNTSQTTNSSATTIPASGMTDSTIDTNFITRSGDDFQIQTDGLYRITFAMKATQTNDEVSIFNVTSSSSIGTASNNSGSVVSTLLFSGDTIRFQVREGVRLSENESLTGNVTNFEVIIQKL